MAQTKTTKQTFTVQMRVVVLAEVEVEADSLEEAMSVGRKWLRKDIVNLEKGFSECDSSVTLTGAYASRYWTAE